MSNRSGLLSANSMKTEQETDFIVAYVLCIFIVAFLGNITTVIVIAMYRELQNTANFYILNLAVADLLMSISTTPTQILLALKPSFLTCQINTFQFIFFFSTSVFAIFSIAFDRWCFICKPLYYRAHFFTMKIKYVISFSWIIAFVFAILPFTALYPRHNKLRLQFDAICAYRVVLPNWYLLLLIILTELLPPVLFSLMYGKIVFVARKHAIEIALQFRSSKLIAMDWLERRRFTESLIAPFENPTVLLGRPRSADNDQSVAIRAILYKNYDAWKQRRREELKKIATTPDVSDESVFDHEDNLSKVGRSLREWKRRATSTSSGGSILERWDRRDREVIETESSKHRNKSNRVAPILNPNTDRKRTKDLPHSSSSNAEPSATQSNIPRFFYVNRMRNRIHAMASQSLKQNSINTKSIVPKFSVLKRIRLGSGKLKVKKEFKAVKMLGMVVGMFVLLHVPIAVLDILDLYSSIKLPSWIFRIAICLTQAGPAVNPLIYVIVKRQFRRAFLRLWSCGRIKRSLAGC